MRSNSLRIALLLSLLLSINVFSNTTGKIVGLVTDKSSGEGLIGVNILVEGTTLGATTDLDGSYLILNIPPGTYTMVFQYIGYQEVRISNVKVSVGFTTEISTPMSEGSVELGETVEVVADREVIRRDLTASQSEVSSEEIDLLPAEEFEDVLQLQSGVTRDADGGFHIRGGRSSEVAFWVDGVSVTDGYDGSLGVEIENDAVQSLQVISGTFNAEYGQAMSGIINIVTKEGGQDYHGSISTYAGDYITNDDALYLGLDETGPDINDIKFSLSGPVPGMSKFASFFVNARRNYDEGYLYGRRDFNPDGSTGDGALVPMNKNEWLSAQGKLTLRLTDLMKLKIGANFEDRQFFEFDHFYKFNPDGNFNKFQYGYNASATLDHTISKTTFYTLKFARFEKEFEQYVYESPTDPRFVDNNDTLFTVAAFQFSRGGQQNQHFLRNTQTNVAKFDITSQLNKHHLVKIGIEGKRHRLFLEEFSTIDGDNSTSNFVPIKPDPANFDRYTFEPVEFSAYIQDKMEYEDLIVNLGLRFDYFNSKGQVLADRMDPSVNFPLLAERAQLTTAERQAIWYKDAEAKVQISPRVGLAYPISERGVVHVSYGHFLQIPEFRLLYQNPAYRIVSGTDNLFGNPNLDAQKTVMYEIGLQQQLSEAIGIDITGFYRDVRNWVSTSPLNETYRPDILYSEYENRDYANVRGITFSLTRRLANNFSANLSYTAQIAEGNASDPNDAFNDIQNNAEPRKLLVPLDWDRTQVLNGNIFFNIKNFGMTLLGRFESGLPYTPMPVQGTTRGSNIQQGISENSERRPNLITFDLQMSQDLTLKFGDRVTRIGIFAKVFNLFDRRNEQTVFGDTGRATYTLVSTVGGENADPRWIVRPDYYTPPRRMQLGVSYDF